MAAATMQYAPSGTGRRASSRGHDGVLAAHEYQKYGQSLRL
jgi:hypothetical protein